MEGTGEGNVMLLGRVGYRDGIWEDRGYGRGYGRIWEYK